MTALETSIAQLAPSLWRHFEERPVTIGQFIYMEEYANQGRWVWPAVGSELENIFGRELATRFDHQEAILKWARGAGKSWGVSMMFAYLLYWLLNLKDPQGYFGLAPGSKIVLLNQSINELQARRVIFTEIKNRVEQTPWFKAHGYVPNPKVQSELQFPKGVIVFPGTSSLTFPQGYHVFGGAVDEAAFFLEKGVVVAGMDDERADPADVIYDTILRGITSRFGGHGLLAAISNPSHGQDFIERKHAFAIAGDPGRNVPPPPRMYASMKALWETRPGPEFDADADAWKPWKMVRWVQQRPRPDGTVEVVREMLVPEFYLHAFRANPEGALRDLAAQSSAVGAGYMWDPDVVDRPSLGFGLPGYNPNRLHPADEHPETRAITFAPWFQQEAVHRDALVHGHCDLSKNRDACGLAFGHAVGETMIAGMRRPVIRVVLMLELKAPPGGQVDYSGIREIVDLVRARGFNLVYMTFDQFQSVDMVQQLNKKKIEAEVMSVDSDAVAYDTWKEAVNEARLDYYRYKPMHECAKSLILAGAKVDHRRGGKKDVTDALAGICRTLTERWMVAQPPASGTVRSAYVTGAQRRGRRTALDRLG